MDVLLAEAAPRWWLALLGLQLTPFAVMTARAFVLSRPGEFRESVAINGTVLAALAGYLVTSTWLAVLVARLDPSAGAGRWLGVFGVHFVVWAFLGTSVAFASFQALDGESAPRVRRWAAAGAMSGVALFHAALLVATRVAWPR